MILVGEGSEKRRIAVRIRKGDGPPLIWLGGFRSEMRSTKATALDVWAQKTGRAFIRFDYSGHGESEGAFEEGTISRWLEEALCILTQSVKTKPILVGSSMGGWISLLLARILMRKHSPLTPLGLVLIAPATDFTEELMWERFPESIQKAVMKQGCYRLPSPYSDDPYPITKGLIVDGRQHLLFGRPIAIGCRAHILQGMKDPDVPWQHALKLVEHLPGDSTTLTLIQDGDHRLSRPEDLKRLIGAIAGMAERS